MPRLIPCMGGKSSSDQDDDEYSRMDGSEVAATLPLITDAEDEDEEWNYFRNRNNYQIQRAQPSTTNRRQVGDTFSEVDATGARLNTKFKRNELKYKFNHILLAIWVHIKSGFHMFTMPGIASMCYFAPAGDLVVEIARRKPKDPELEDYPTTWV